MALTAPILVESVNGVQVRFYVPPTDVPEMPWVALDDVAAAVRMRPDMRADLPQILRRDFPSVVKTVASATAMIDVIVSHSVVMRLIELFQEAALIGLDVEQDYWRAAHRALVPYALGGRNGDEGLSFAIQAYAKAV